MGAALGSTPALQGMSELWCLHYLTATDMPVANNDMGEEEGVLGSALQPGQDPWGCANL